MIDFLALPLGLNAALMALSAAVVWFAGTRLSYYADAIAVRIGMGRAFAGFLLLGGVTFLPELVTTTTASLTGNPVLAVNNILGSVAFNAVLLAMADALLGRDDALTSVIASPSTLLQGMLGIVLLGVVAAGIAVGDYELFGMGIWSAALVPLFALVVWLASRHENHPTWVAYDHIDVYLAKRDGIANPVPAEPIVGLPLGQLFRRAAGVALLILIGGYTLAETGDAIATQTGIGAGLVGFVLLGIATSLSEISVVVGAVRLRRYEMAVGDIFGANVFDLLLVALADGLYSGGPILALCGRFEILAALLGIILTTIYVIGFLDRRNRTFLRMGYDSLAAIIVYGTGIFVLSQV